MLHPHQDVDQPVDDVLVPALATDDDVDALHVDGDEEDRVEGLPIAGRYSHALLDINRRSNASDAAAHQGVLAEDLRALLVGQRVDLPAVLVERGLCGQLQIAEVVRAWRSAANSGSSEGALHHGASSGVPPVGRALGRTADRQTDAPSQRRKLSVSPLLAVRVGARAEQGCGAASQTN